MPGFPSLQPAMTILVHIDAGIQIGSASRGTPLTVVPMKSGSIKTEPGFEPALDAQLHGTGYDYIRNDPSGALMRLDVRAQVKNGDGELLALYYKGPVAITEGLRKILSGSDEVRGTDYGDSFISVEFETGSEKLKPLESMLFVAAGHFIKEDDGGVTVEYKVSRVLKG